jgi:Acetyltransferases
MTHDRYKSLIGKSIHCLLASDAVDGTELGHVIVEEKPTKGPIEGTDWFIWNIFTLPQLRRQGIASRLIEELTGQAQKANVLNLVGSANPTVQATGFWISQGFCLQRYGQKSENRNNPLEFGNYHHLIFKRISDADGTKCGDPAPKGYTLCRADELQMDHIFEGYVRSSDVLYYRDKRDSMKAITITDRGNALRGFIVLLKERIGEPVELEQMWIPYLYIEPRARGQGLARRLLHAAMDDARNENVRQLIFLSSKSESYPFWHKNGFSAFLWSHLAERNTALAAGILV